MIIFEPSLIFVATGEVETSRCDGCDSMGMLKVYVYKRMRKVLVRIRLCERCQPVG